MNGDSQQLIAVAAAVLGLLAAVWLISKFWKALLAIGVLGAAGLTLLCMSSPGDCPFDTGGRPKPVPPPSTPKPWPEEPRVAGGQQPVDPRDPPPVPRPSRQALPDLDVQLLEWPSIEAPCGHKELRVRFAIGNKGDTTIQSAKVRIFGGHPFQREDRYGGDFEVQQLKPHEDFTGYAYPDLAGWRRVHGYHTTSIRVVVDPDNKIAESNENNNVSRTVQLTCFLKR